MVRPRRPRSQTPENDAPLAVTLEPERRPWAAWGPSADTRQILHMAAPRGSGAAATQGPTWNEAGAEAGCWREWTDAPVTLQRGQGTRLPGSDPCCALSLPAPGSWFMSLVPFPHLPTL